MLSFCGSSISSQSIEKAGTDEVTRLKVITLFAVASGLSARPYEMSVAQNNIYLGEQHYRGDRESSPLQAVSTLSYSGRKKWKDMSRIRIIVLRAAQCSRDSQMLK